MLFLRRKNLHRFALKRDRILHSELLQEARESQKKSEADVDRVKREFRIYSFAPNTQEWRASGNESVLWGSSPQLILGCFV